MPDLALDLRYIRYEMLVSELRELPAGRGCLEPFSVDIESTYSVA
jgi:hypothetical protein